MYDGSGQTVPQHGYGVGHGRFNFNKSKGTISGKSRNVLFCVYLLANVLTYLLVLEMLATTASERDAALARVRELEEQIATLQEESASARRESEAAA